MTVWSDQPSGSYTNLTPPTVGYVCNFMREHFIARGLTDCCTSESARYKLFYMDWLLIVSAMTFIRRENTRLWTESLLVVDYWPRFRRHPLRPSR